MKFHLLILSIILTIGSLSGQEKGQDIKVGLALSGGGAKVLLILAFYRLLKSKV